jgi:hypothetical protein
MAAALLAAEERSPASCEKLAAKLGLNMDKYKAYVADPVTDQEIDRRVEWLDEKTYPGLPVIWIENQKLLGAQTSDSLHAAWQRATGADGRTRKPTGEKKMTGKEDEEITTESPRAFRRSRPCLWTAGPPGL